MRTSSPRVLVLAGVLSGALSVSLLATCRSQPCLEGGDAAACALPSPCAKLTFTCSGGSAKAHVFAAGDPVPGGLDGIASPGDFVLENDQVVAVIDALDHPHYVAPSGGTLVDLARQGGPDALNQVLQATGLLPFDAAHYTSAHLVSGDGFAALDLVGTLDGRPDLRIATRYEVRPCEPGVRVHTEAVNLGADPQIWSLTDGWYWSGRENVPFTPTRGTGFVHPGFGLTTVGDVFQDVPYMVATAHTGPAASYVDVACDRKALSGFQSDQISAMGTPRRILPPRGRETFDRFIGVVNGRSVGPGADLALEVRRQLFGEAYATLHGALAEPGGGGSFGSEIRATVRVAEGHTSDTAAERTPWTQITPAADGTFTVRVPAGRTYVLSVEAFGQPVAEKEVTVGTGDTDAGTLTVPKVAKVNLVVTRDGLPGDALVLFHPADHATEEDTLGRLLGVYTACAPLLGSPAGGSPACNRVLVHGGTASLVAPPGHYDVYAVAGPFHTIARQEITVAPGATANVVLPLVSLGIKPAGTLSADFHVHGGASFDSSIPDLDRVEAFLAADIDVIAATDHDVVHDYAAAMQQLGAAARLHLMTGVETTGHVLWTFVPGDYVPKVIGHWNFWPLKYQPDDPYRGSVWDELAEPGQLIQRMKDKGWDQATGVAELNHPWAAAEFGRDLGFPRAIGMNLLEPLPKEDDGSAQALFDRTPPGTTIRNSDYNVQEVMNGSKNEELLSYRALWFYLLDEGVVRGGTANSDSHGLFANVLGTPRNLVFTDQTVAGFDETAFDAQVRAGRMIGTNGPIILVHTTDAQGHTVTPSVAPFTPASDARLSIEVRAAPWVPVTEIRVVVDGKVAKTITGLPQPADPFGVTGTLRYQGELDLTPLLPADGRDAWVVVEAGTALPVAGDLDCNGVPDTTDNNGDGKIDWKDVDRNGDGVVDQKDQDVNGDGWVTAADVPKACEGGTGPIENPAIPTDRNDPAHIFEAVVPGGYPAAFTNPLVLDRDGNGFQGPGLPKEVP